MSQMHKVGPKMKHNWSLVGVGGYSLGPMHYLNKGREYVRFEER